LKEFGELTGVDVIVDPADVELDPASLAALEGDKTATKNVDMLRAYAERGATGAPRRIVMRFLVSPVDVLGGDGKMTGVRIEKNVLAPSADGSLRPRGTGVFEEFPAGMILRSVGYRGAPLPGVPFDEATGTIPNVAGRVVQAAGGEVVPGEYVVGWAKRGPSGVIGTNKPDSVATVQAMLADLATLPGATSDADIAALLHDRGVDYVSYADWKHLDAYEAAQGEAQGRPRVKVTRVAEMLDVVHQGRNG
jgi:ferredoxin--NADP+ reductase